MNHKKAAFIDSLILFISVTAESKWHYSQLFSYFPILSNQNIF